MILPRDLLSLSLHNLFLHKVRSILTSLGVIFGVGSVIAMLAISEGAKQKALAQLDALGIDKIIVYSKKPPVEAQQQNSNNTQLVNYGLTTKDIGNFAKMDNIASITKLWDSRQPILRGLNRLSTKLAAVDIGFMTESNSKMISGRWLTPADYDVADYLRRSRKRVVLVVNKVDEYSPDKLFEFYALGLGEPYGVSSEHARGIGDVLDAALLDFSPSGSEEDDGSLKIAVVGKPNAGKSSLVNRILGQERTIVTPIAGTTRDAIDTPFTRDGKQYTIIDTAGIRRKRSVGDDVEYYSVLRAFDAVRRADVVLLVVDAQEGITEQDVKIIGFVHEEGKPSVVVMNKWDTVEKDTHTVEKFEEKLREELKFMDYFKSVYISAKTGQRVEKVLALAREAYEHASFRVQTGALNDLLMDAMRIAEPPSYQGRRIKLYYASQVAVRPPLFLLMVNDETLLHFSYARYLENVIRQAYDFSGTPIRIQVRSKKEDE